MPRSDSITNKPSLREVFSHAGTHEDKLDLLIFIVAETIGDAAAEKAAEWEAKRRGTPVVPGLATSDEVARAAVDGTTDNLRKRIEEDAKLASESAIGAVDNEERLRSQAGETYAEKLAKAEDTSDLTSSKVAASK